MVVCRAANVRQVREGSRRVFVTAALGFADAITGNEILRTAFIAVTSGADAVITGRGYKVVRMLTDESIPVMGHLGFVPRKSTWVGSIRAVGKTSAEALALWDRFQRLEDAGAFGVECELIAGAVMSEISRRTSLVTVSLGSGADADVIFLFTSDICARQRDCPAMHAPGATCESSTRRFVRSGSRRSPGSGPTLRPDASRRTTSRWPCGLPNSRNFGPNFAEARPGSLSMIEARTGVDGEARREDDLASVCP